MKFIEDKIGKKTSDFNRVYTVYRASKAAKRTKLNGVVDKGAATSTLRGS